MNGKKTNRITASPTQKKKTRILYQRVSQRTELLRLNLNLKKVLSLPPRCPGSSSLILIILLFLFLFLFFFLEPQLTLEDLNSARISRIYLAKWVHLPWFEDVVTGAFVRYPLPPFYIFVWAWFSVFFSPSFALSLKL